MTLVRAFLPKTTVTSHEIVTLVGAFLAKTTEVSHEIGRDEPSRPQSRLPPPALHHPLEGKNLR